MSSSEEGRFEREVSLEDLSKRNPGVKAYVNQVTFEIGSGEPPEDPPDDPNERRRKQILRIIRDVTIAVVVGIALVYVGPHLPGLVPG